MDRQSCEDDVTEPPQSPAVVAAGDAGSAHPSALTGLGIPIGLGAGHGLPVKVGHYLLTRELGTGGMGTVYEAVQDQPRRVVAIKLLRASAQKRRFEFESTLLARLRHPGIAQIFEAGTHVHGDLHVPYFAMEFIPGASAITRYAEVNKLSVAARLKLFTEVCDAVQHANLLGIIHRDLKPGNILIDVQGKPKVIDFGVARAADSDQFSPTMQTDASQLIGTLQYMSPEQCSGDPRNVDARSDVYSLGVVLYELLCGQLPYDLSKVNVSDATKIIRDLSPAKPSAVDPALKGDLETVLLKALHKDRSRRYQSAGELAADIRHVLVGEPIEARRDSAVYVLRTRARRITARQHLVALIGSLVIGVVIAEACNRLADPSGADRQFERIMMTAAPLAANMSPVASEFMSVRIIAMQDGTDFDALAASRGLKGVHAANRPSLRRLHGELMKILVEKGVGFPVLAFDISFYDSSEFDQDFVDGVDALHAHGTDVVAAARSWSQEPSQGKPISPLIRSHAKSASVSAQCSANAPWSVQLYAWRKDLSEPPQASFALTTAAEFLHPRARISLVPDGRLDQVFVFCTHSDGSTVRERFDASMTYKLKEADLVADLSAGDYYAQYILKIPNDDVLGRATISYADVFSASAQELRQRLNGHALVVADERRRDVTPPAKPDLFPHTDGRLLSGGVAHAVAVESLLTARAIRKPRWFSVFHFGLEGGFIFSFAGVLVGALIGHLLARRWGFRLAAAFLTIICAVVFSVLVYRQARALYNPLGAIVGVVLTAELVGLVRRARTASVGLSA